MCLDSLVVAKSFGFCLLTGLLQMFDECGVALWQFWTLIVSHLKSNIFLAVMHSSCIYKELDLLA